MTKKRKNKPSGLNNDFCVATEAAFVLVQRAIAIKRAKGEEYPPEWEDPEFVREKIAPALLNKALARVPLL